MENDKENCKQNIFRIDDGVEKGKDRRSVSRGKSKTRASDKIKCVVKNTGNSVKRLDGRAKCDSRGNLLDNRDSFVYAKDKGMSDFVSTSMSNYASSKVGSRQTPNNLLSRLNHVFK